MRESSARTLAALVLSGLFLCLIGCGGGTAVEKPVFKPIFTSAPVIAATEAAVYSYSVSAVDPAGGGVFYSLIAAPEGASLNGNTISWTPTASQSRRPNIFSVTARTASGGSDTQSWTVSPNGTVRVSWVDTYWGESGATLVPWDFTQFASSVVALIPQSDGTMLTLQGSGGVDGQLAIPNVPAGHYWLRLLGNSFYWTSSSDVDLGADNPAYVPRLGTPGGTYSPRATFTLHGLEPSPDGALEITLDAGIGITAWPVTAFLTLPI
jgi:hypothetical protein